MLDSITKYPIHFSQVNKFIIYTVNCNVVSSWIAAWILILHGKFSIFGVTFSDIWLRLSAYHGLKLVTIISQYALNQLNSLSQLLILYIKLDILSILLF